MAIKVEITPKFGRGHGIGYTIRCKSPDNMMEEELRSLLSDTAVQDVYIYTDNSSEPYTYVKPSMIPDSKWNFEVGFLSTINDTLGDVVKNLIQDFVGVKVAQVRSSKLYVEKPYFNPYVEYCDVAGIRNISQDTDFKPSVEYIPIENLNKKL